MKLRADLQKIPLGSLVVLKTLKADVEIEWCDENRLFIKDGQTFTSDSAIFRYLCRLEPSLNLLGSNLLHQCQVDHWISFSVGPLSCERQFEESLSYLDNKLACATYLVDNRFSAADVAVWTKMVSNSKWNNFKDDIKNIPRNVHRWFSLIGSNDFVAAALKDLPENSSLYTVKENESGRKEEGKFVDLPGAEIGKVIVRFPPEASGYLHIGHAKAALLNQYYRDAFKGKLIMRFDDTNPAKEKVDFEKVILEDLSLLKVEHDLFTHTSDYFDLMLEKCQQLLKSNRAYVDDTDPEVMKNEREQKVASVNRNNSVEKNLKMWGDMMKGTQYGQKCCVRAKIDMNSLNGCMRDPTIYRCKNEAHPKTGLKYKVYPTYDFACPIVDSIEGVTHCLRTMEYHDRDEQFYWFIDAMGLRKPYIWEYSRLNMTNTVLSKRKLTWFVDNGVVDGWDDPRMPTVRGVLRRGMTVEGLKQFIIAQGSSRSVVVMEWDKIWAINKKVIDPIAPRYTAVDATHKVRLSVNGVKEEATKAVKHPKNPEVGEKTVWIGSSLWIDEADALVMKVGENVTLINWGNVKIKEIKRSKNIIEEVIADPNFEDKNYKKTLKITWLADTPQAPLVECYCVYFEHIVSKPILGKDEDFKNYIGHNTRTEVKVIGDPELKTLKKSDIIQVQRKGFFICDVPYSPPSVHTGRATPVVLFFIPDGHTKEMPTSIPSALKLQSSENSQASIVSEGSVKINSEILAQGDVVRKLKQENAAKGVIDLEVGKLLKLKELFKSKSGQDWKPGVIAAEKQPAKSSANTQQEPELHKKITALGNKIRTLKSEKAAKDVITNSVKELLKLKEDYKNIVGKEWVPKSEAEDSTSSKPLPLVNFFSSQLSNQIKLQGDTVRELKTKKAPKSDIDKEVAALISLKTKYKELSGQDWKPENLLTMKPNSSSTEQELNSKILDQGNKVRNLKSAKSAKNIIDTEIATLLSLKAEYKSVTGADWKLDNTQSKNAKNKNSNSGKPQSVSEGTAPSGDVAGDLDSKIREQGDKVRSLKSTKSDKSVVDAEVSKLLTLKAEYKAAVGKEWKPDNTKPKEVSSSPKVKAEEPPKTNSDSKYCNAVSGLEAKIKEQGEAVRQLKASGASKDSVNESVQKLLSLKFDYKKLTGKEFVSEAPNQNRKSKPKKESKQEQKKKEVTPDKESSVKKVTRLGLEASKEENLPDWYSQVITKGELIEYYDVSGCYILRPWSFAIWEVIQNWLDKEFKALGVKNCYFPIFVSKAALEKEKTHIADFAPEVAWVTKSGDSDLAEPIAVRPTSETVMYPAYAKWIQSYRDLPIKLNQWNNVVRWEFKHPQPFLRTREFLWQEGHTAYASSKEAEEEVTKILELYAKVYTDLLAIPVVRGRKTEKEKFAGGDYTLTVEAYISASGRAIQGATSHHLGQNFSKMFDIIYEDPETQEKKLVYQNSWGITTRTIGVMIMVHADNQGLVLPPRVASVQVVIVPCGITASLSEVEKEKLLKTCHNVETELKTAGIRSEGDYRDNYSPGWKFNHWELKGVPIRIEIGPKDMQSGQVVAVRRDTGAKTNILSSNIVREIEAMLANIHDSLLQKSTEELSSHKVVCKDWNEFCQKLDKKYLLLSPFCGDIKCEETIKERSTRSDAEADAGAPSMGAKTLCIPFEQPGNGIAASDKCINPDCAIKPTFYTMFGRSY